MGYLASFRQGWQSENLARFLLSKVAFVAHPSSVSDDIGSDFFCTLFRTERRRAKEYLVPRSSFAIQIKSNAKPIDVSKKTGYLSALEIPFFVGVVNRARLSLRVYSGEAIPFLFAYLGRPDSLTIELTPDAISDHSRYCEVTNSGNVTVRFPLVGDLTHGGVGHAGLAHRLDERCSLMLRNLAAKQNDEYIFQFPGGDTPSVAILAGPGSVQVFRENFLRRLAEAFCNFGWIFKNSPGSVSQSEFAIFEWVYGMLAREYPNLPKYLSASYMSAKSAVGSSHPEALREGVAQSPMLDATHQPLHDLYAQLPPAGKAALIEEARRLLEADVDRH